MNSSEQILENIKKLSKKQETLLIGIDGFGGSGKSTLSKYLQEKLGKTIIVEMDDFYLPTLKRADYIRVDEQVLEPLHENRDASYQRYDWKIDSLAEWHPIKKGGIVIIEGVYSIHPDIADKYDYKIWVACDQEIGFQRGVTRDKVRDKVDNTDKWLNIWMPQEKEYVDTYNPKQDADFILESIPESSSSF